jgi:carboxypeptidase T
MRPAIRGRRSTTVAVLLSLALALPLGAQALASPGSDRDAPQAAVAKEETRHTYEVRGVTSPIQRSALAAEGVAIDTSDDHAVTITADRATAERLRKQGYELHRVEEGGFQAASTPSQYTSYASAMQQVNSLASQYPNLVRRQVIGRSYQGRDIVAVKVSSNVHVDEDKPEILFTHNMHAREHLTTEMGLYLIRELARSYSSDAQVRRLLDSREIWIVPVLNPDGKVHDMSSGRFLHWRKNRQPHGSAVGTDINRNFAYLWGCCGGSSSNPASDTYRGPSAESAPETRVIRDFVRSRIIGGRQQITAHIDFHSYSELILWPYGYTYNDTAPGLSQDDHAVFATVGRQMAATNGYRPQQSSDLYITDGSIGDWMWGNQRIFSYTFEMYPRSASGGGFYPPGSVINRETSRNRQAVLILLENADCMYRSIGKEQQYCSS